MAQPALHGAAMTDVPPRVFLSYARKDGEAFATALRRRLADEEPGITLWQDLVELEGGRNQSCDRHVL